MTLVVEGLPPIGGTPASGGLRPKVRRGRAWDMCLLPLPLRKTEKKKSRQRLVFVRLVVVWGWGDHSPFQTSQWAFRKGVEKTENSSVAGRRSWWWRRRPCQRAGL